MTAGPQSGSWGLPLAAVIIAMMCFQVSAALAKSMFPVLGADGTAVVRLALAGLLLLALTRPWRAWPKRAHWPALIGLGVSTAASIGFFYQALERLPQGVVVGLQFLGPLAVALFGSRRPRDVVWAALAAAGVWGLVGPGAGPVSFDPVGVLFALGAGAGWAGYILFGRTAGGDLGHSAGALSIAMAAVLLLPIGGESAAPVLSSATLLGLGLVLAVVSTALPIQLELYALPRMPARTFAVLMSLEPAFAAISGFAFMGERLTLAQIGGLVAVMLAAAGASWTAMPRTRSSSKR
jgi:inner membrane transporter RhtA